ncbi:hypothetical protein EDC94DRAFT_587676 [Helicostylum pulchrum]|nr:hypothetical protein EDC94DRAFT_587676 [Helicostylum pulchrum]
MIFEPQASSSITIIVEIWVVTFNFFLWHQSFPCIHNLIYPIYVDQLLNKTTLCCLRSKTHLVPEVKTEWYLVPGTALFFDFQKMIGLVPGTTLFSPLLVPMLNKISVPFVVKFFTQGSFARSTYLNSLIRLLSLFFSSFESGYRIIFIAILQFSQIHYQIRLIQDP